MMRCFADIVIGPATRMAAHIVRGGPLWPDFDAETALRHCREGVAVDAAPLIDQTPDRRIDQPAVWGGHIDRHFGHYVAEHFSRLPQALAERPDDLYLFTAEPRVQPDDVPAFFWAIMDWIGLPRAQIVIITSPVIAQELRAAPRAEQLSQTPPAQDYLTLLEANAARRGVWGAPRDTVYVTRVGYVAQGNGGHFGESYLADCLVQLGVRLLDPAMASLTDQMRAYAGAEVLIFEEGSALHGRQLLGHVAQDIVVINRRPGRRLAQGVLTPRCRGLSYANVNAGWLVPEMPGGRRKVEVCAAFYNVAALWHLFEACGVDLKSVWQPDRFAQAEASDLDGWLGDGRVPVPVTPETARLLRERGHEKFLPRLSAAP